MLSISKKFLVLLSCLISFFAFSSTAHAAKFSLAPNNLGLVGYWSFNEGGGSIAHDFSGNGNSGTLQSSPTWVNGKRGKALQ